MITLSVVAVAALSGTAAGAAPSDANEQDRRFLVQMHQDNLAEIATGRTAAKKGHSRSVRAMGRRLAADRTRLDADLRQVAQRLAVPLPEQPSMEQRIQRSRISAREGEEFDWAWSSATSADHRTTLARTARELEEGSSPPVRKLAADAEPVVRRQLNMLRRHVGDDADGDVADETGGGDDDGSRRTEHGGVSGY
ncbi:DUF4142 domain-containing protein [Streptosporangium sp. NPDC051023]|uniref:DUF4142 domain-containing protein n=1 Tax=Streptosporangium sp. NPDC051023 TaxID=3155410 RepID=UPI00344CBFD9